MNVRDSANLRMDGLDNVDACQGEYEDDRWDQSMDWKTSIVKLAFRIKKGAVGLTSATEHDFLLSRRSIFSVLMTGRTKRRTKALGSRYEEHLRPQCQLRLRNDTCWGREDPRSDDSGYEEARHV